MSLTIPAGVPNLKLNTEFEFKPFYTPNEMLKMGIYGGSYFGRARNYLDDPPLKYIFQGVPNQNYIGWDYNQAINYFAVTPERLERGLNIPSALKQKHPLGWFQWYMSYYSGRTNRSLDAWRINQWLENINTDWYYIANDTYSGGGSRFTDLTFKKDRRQRMLEFGVDPTIDPVSYGCGFEF